MGQLSEAIQVKNVLDFYNIDNFVETGTGAAEVVRSISNLRPTPERSYYRDHQRDL